MSREAGMPRVETLTEIPDEEVDEVVEDFRSEGAKVQKKPENGTWTVIATFPDEGESKAAKAKAKAKATTTTTTTTTKKATPAKAKAAKAKRGKTKKKPGKAKKGGK